MADVKVIIRTVDQGSKEVVGFGKKLEGVLDVVTKSAAAAAAAGAVFKQAFDLAQEGAQLNQLRDSFELMNAQVFKTPDLLENMSAAVRGTIKDTDLMKSLLTLTAGASNEASQAYAAAAPKLLEIAKASNKLNPALGDTAFLFDSLALGIKRGSPLILDNLGITIKVGEANEKYAEQLGKTVEQLTGEEKQMALLNAVMESGDVLINQVGGSVASQGDAWARLEVQMGGAFDRFKQFEATRLEGVVGGITSTLDVLNDEVVSSRSGWDNFMLTVLEVGKVVSWNDTILNKWTDSIKGNDAALTRTTPVVMEHADQVQMSAWIAEQNALAAEEEARAFAALTEHLRTTTEDAGKLSGAQAMLNSEMTSGAEAVPFDAYERWKTAMENSADVMEHTREVAAALAAEQAMIASQTGDLFTEFSEADGALKFYNESLDELGQQYITVGGRTAEQGEDLEKLQNAYDKAAGTVRDYELGIKGANLSDEARAEKIAEQQELMASYAASMEPLLGIQGELVSVNNELTVNTEAVNSALYAAADAAGADAGELALLQVATGQMSEAQAEAVIKSVALEQTLNNLGAQYANGTLSVNDYIAAAQQAVIDINNMTVSFDTQVGAVESDKAAIASLIDSINLLPSQHDFVIKITTEGEIPALPSGPGSSKEAAAFSHGGMVTGGVPGLDSVPALLMPGERVLTRSEAEQWNRGERGGGNTTINAPITVNVQGGGDPNAIANAINYKLMATMRAKGL